MEEINNLVTTWIVKPLIRRRANLTYLNRPEAVPALLRFYKEHETEGIRPPLTVTHLLPVRTWITTEQFDANPVLCSGTKEQQLHAYYEEILSIPAGAASTKTPFGHWYVVWPLTKTSCDRLNADVLERVIDWVAKTRHFYRGAHSQVKEFVRLREESLINAEQELWARRSLEAGKTKELTGDWEIVDEFSKGDARGRAKGKVDEFSAEENYDDDTTGALGDTDEDVSEDEAELGIEGESEEEQRPSTSRKLWETAILS